MLLKTDFRFLGFYFLKILVFVHFPLNVYINYSSNIIYIYIYIYIYNYI